MVTRYTQPPKQDGVFLYLFQPVCTARIAKRSACILWWDAQRATFPLSWRLLQGDAQSLRCRFKFTVSLAISFSWLQKKRCRRIKSETTLLPQIPPPSSSVHFLSSFSVQKSCYCTRTCLWHLASKEELQTPLPEATLKQLITLS